MCKDLKEEDDEDEEEKEMLLNQIPNRNKLNYKKLVKETSCCFCFKAFQIYRQRIFLICFSFDC